MRARLIQATVAAVEDNKGVRGLSLRGIAKAAGCSHVNVYHYADGLEGLLWLAYSEALSSFTRAALDSIEGAKGGRSFGSLTAQAIVGFALEREGLYRLLWFEDLPGAPSPDLWKEIAAASKTYRLQVGKALEREALPMPGAASVAGGSNSAGASRRPLGPDEAADYFFAYLQGEIALLLNGRLGPDRQAAAEALLARAGKVWTILVEARVAAGPGGREEV